MKNSLTRKYLQDFLMNVLNNYPHIRDRDTEILISDTTRYHSKIIDELLKYYKKEDVCIYEGQTYKETKPVKVDDIYESSIKSANITFGLNSLDRNNKDMKVSIYYGINTSNAFPVISLNIYGNGAYVNSNTLNIMNIPDIIKAFIDLNKSIGIVVERAILEEGKAMKKTGLLYATIKAFIKKEFGDNTFVNNNTESGEILKITVDKDSWERFFIEIDMKKVDDDINVVLNKIKDLLRLSDCGWLEFKYEKL